MWTFIDNESCLQHMQKCFEKRNNKHLRNESSLQTELLLTRFVSVDCTFVNYDGTSFVMVCKKKNVHCSETSV